MRIPADRRPLLSTCLLLACVLAGACSDTPPAIRLADDAVFLAFGDSITFGSGAEKEHSYPAILARLSGHRVINAGVPGEISAAGRQRLPELLDAHQPGLLILCHGGNDLLRRIRPADTRANLEAMVESASQRNIPVLLIGVPAPALLFLEASELYGEVATKHALLYEGEILSRVESDPGLKSDRVHPNAAGYRQIALAVYELLQDNGALR